MASRSITQRSFVLGELREDFLEAKDLDLRQASVRGGLNCQITASRAIKARMGSFYARTLTTARDLVEIRLASGEVYGLIINDTSLQVIDADAQQVALVGSVAWTDGSTVWTEPFRDYAVIGCPQGLFMLRYDGWSLVAFSFASAAGNEIAQPYWSFVGDVQIQPSGLTGVVTVTANKAIWTPAYVGQRIRYGFREIAITGYTSPTVVTGTVVTSLPPSFTFQMQSGSSFRIGDLIVGADTGFEAVVVGITGNFVSVATTSFYDGPDINEVVAGPSGGSKVLVKVQIAPLPSPIWDEPLFSPARGYPRAGASAAGRLWLIDHPLIPDIVAASSARDETDFELGVSDDDAIVRQVGDNSPRFLHAVNAGDLLLFSDKGLYYINIRDGSVITPTSFNPIKFDERASNDVRPVKVQAGVVFVQASGEEVAAATLSGDFYSKWEVRTISTFHAHLVKTPVKLCGPAINSAEPDKYMFVVNGDGTLAALSWSADFTAENVGFLPWATQGAYRSISPIFNGYWSIVDRTIAGVSKRFLERMDESALLDCSTAITQPQELTVNGLPLTVNGEPLTIVGLSQTPFAGATLRVHAGNYDLGDALVAGDGTIEGSGDFPANAQAGFNFESRVLCWPQEWIESERAGLLKARVVQGSVSVQSTGVFQIRANKNTRTRGGYRFGDDLEAEPPLRTEVVKFPVTGVRDHPEIEIIKPGPTRFSVLAITQEARF